MCVSAIRPNAFPFYLFFLRDLSVHAHLELFLLLRERHGRVIVQTLGHQLEGERVLLRRALLDLGPLVLEPDLDLRLVQPQLGTERLPPLFRQIAIFVELILQRPREEAQTNGKRLEQMANSTS